MEERNNNRVKWLHVRLTLDEHATITTRFRNTTEAKMSDYARKIMLGKPVIKAVRDTSLTDIIAVLTRCQKDLNGVANNFNQAIKKLHTYKDDSSIEATVLTMKIDEKCVLKAVEELRSLLLKTQAKWLQE